MLETIFLKNCWFVCVYEGFLLRHEVETLKNHMNKGDYKESRFSLHVINWAILLVREGRDKGYLENASDASRLLDPLIAFKKSCSVVLKYQVTAIPLSFVQVYVDPRLKR